MILRRFMQHVGEQNWLAVGLDFLIVIFGVVIGLQITAGNEARQDRALERSYYRQLILDLETDQATGRRGVQAANQGDAYAELLRDVLEGGDGATADGDIIKAVLRAGYVYLPRANRTTYEELISTGHLSLLRDIEIKRALSAYYERAASARQWDDLVRAEQLAYRAAIRGLLSREQAVWARAANDGDGAPAPALDQEQFLAKARGRPQIIESLSSLAAVQERMRGDSARMEALAGDLIDWLRSKLAQPQSSATSSSR